MDPYCQFVLVRDDSNITLIDTQKNEAYFFIMDIPCLYWFSAMTLTFDFNFNDKDKDSFQILTLEKRKPDRNFSDTILVKYQMSKDFTKCFEKWNIC